MMGDIIAWILGFGTVAMFAAAGRAARRRREQYHRELIREFSQSDETQPESAGWD